MTTMEATPIEALDLSDLDLLDDPDRHLFCVGCNGSGPGVGVAACGKRGLSQGIPAFVLPPDICADCRDLMHEPCARCGR